MRGLLILSIVLLPFLAHGQDSDRRLAGLIFDQTPSTASPIEADPLAEPVQPWAAPLSTERPNARASSVESLFDQVYSFENAPAAITADEGLGGFVTLGPTKDTATLAYGEPDTLALMANAYWASDFGRFRPYFGAGLGGAYVSAEPREPAGASARVQDTALAYRAMAGVEYRLSNGVALGARYGYFGTHDQSFDKSTLAPADEALRAHNLLITVRLVP